MAAAAHGNGGVRVFASGMGKLTNNQASKGTNIQIGAKLVELLYRNETWLLYQRFQTFVKKMPPHPLQNIMAEYDPILGQKSGGNVQATF